MQDSEIEDLESFLAEDLLASLGAIRIAVSWIEADTNSGPSTTAKSGLNRIATEVKALHARSLAQYRLIRQAQRSTHQPNLQASAVEPAPPPQSAGLAPQWLGREAAVNLDALPDVGPVPIDVPLPDASETIRSEPINPAPQEDLGDSIDDLLASALSSGSNDAREQPQP